MRCFYNPGSKLGACVLGKKKNAEKRFSEISFEISTWSMDVQTQHEQIQMKLDGTKQN